MSPVFGLIGTVGFSAQWLKWRDTKFQISIPLMRAVIVNDFGPIDSHKVKEFEASTAGKGEVLIDVHSVGLNYPDILMLQGKYQTKAECLFVPAGDVSGVGAAVGEGVTRVQLGDRVAAPLR